MSQIILLSLPYEQNYSNSENNLIYIISYSNIPTLSNEKNSLCVYVNRFKIQDMFVLWENFSTVKLQKKRTQQRCLIGKFFLKFYLYQFYLQIWQRGQPSITCIEWERRISYGLCSVNYTNNILFPPRLFYDLEVCSPAQRSLKHIHSLIHSFSIPTFSWIRVTGA